MWNYQELIFSNNIEWILETGTKHGGSAVFFADLLSIKNSPGKVITLDINETEIHPIAKSHPKVEIIIENSSFPEVAKYIFDSLCQ